MDDGGPGNERLHAPSEVAGAQTTYQGGRRVEQSWNRRVFGPSLVSTAAGTADTLTADTLTAELGAFGDGDGRWGAATTSSASTTLTRDSVVVGSSAQAGSASFAVPAAAGRYQLSVRANRSAPFDLSTSVSVDWAFRCANTGTRTTALPLWSIGFAPPLDATNSTPTGVRFTVPVVVTAQIGAGVGRLRELTAEASYDDGGTWTSVPVLRGSDGTARAVIDNPALAGYVSLRAHSRDSAGNTTDQTIIHAYRVTGSA